MEHSDALKTARKKFELIEIETMKGTQQLKKKLDAMLKQVQAQVEILKQTEAGRKALDEFNKAYEQTSQTLNKASDAVQQAEAMKQLTESVKAIHREIDEQGETTLYRTPEKLQKRIEHAGGTAVEIKADETTTGVQLHKDSRWYQTWENFKESNQYVGKIFEFKSKYDESDNPIVRASRLLTEKVTGLFGGAFARTELSETLMEIMKMDPSFNKDQFLYDCRHSIIPNILEAIIQGNLEILRDWCYDGPYNILSQPAKTAANLGYKFDSKLLDIDNLDLMAGKTSDQGPMLIISFQTQQVSCVRNSKGDVVEGDENTIQRVQHLWVLCRDQEELNPKAAWRLLEIHMDSRPQFI